MKKKKVTLRDSNAKTMWGRVRSTAFKDKTKYTRKEKYKNNYR